MNQQDFLTTIGGVFSQSAQASGSATPGGIARSAVFDGDAATTLINTSAATLNMGSTDNVIIGGWVKFTAAPDGVHLAGKFRSDDSIDYVLNVNGTGDKKGQFTVQKTAAGAAATAKFGSAFTTGTTYFVLGYVNNTAKTVSVSVNGAAAVTVDFSAGADAFSGDTGAFEIGGSVKEGTTLTGLMDEVFVCLNPADLSAAISEINTTVYNSGTGRRYGALTAQQKTTIGLVSWWGLDELSGSRLDLHGSIDLTPTAITAGTALVS